MPSLLVAGSTTVHPDIGMVALSLSLMSLRSQAYLSLNKVTFSG